ncbi:hypothetical protein SH2C18_37130 [Clostridium sediminicola]|uniref:RNA polymerase sigma factor n=1 Tax=Clostridium sediminicola TaxID=3114879 RepID=UPI0031F20889
MATTYPIITVFTFLSAMFFHVKEDLLKKFIENEKKQCEKVIQLSDVEDKSNINKKVEKILNIYGNSILRMAYSYLHNMCDAEDVLEDTLMQYIKTTPNFKNTTHEKAWLMRVSINISKNKIIYNKRRKTSELDENIIEKEREDLTYIWESIRNLPQKYREVIHLFYQEGYSTAQIAEVLQKKEATVRSLLYRGRSKLKGILKEAYDFEE